jgi:hypothetical protein
VRKYEQTVKTPLMPPTQRRAYLLAVLLPRRRVIRSSKEAVSDRSTEQQRRLIDHLSGEALLRALEGAK